MTFAQNEALRKKAYAKPPKHRKGAARFRQRVPVQYQLAHTAGQESAHAFVAIERVFSTFAERTGAPEDAPHDSARLVVGGRMTEKKPSRATGVG